MNVKVRNIKVDAETADALEAQAAARGISVAELLAEYASADAAPSAFDRMQAEGRGPWAPEVLAEDARRLEEFERKREGVPWDEVRAWIESWGTPNELPAPKPRKL
jgi:hypothetical protein